MRRGLLTLAAMGVLLLPTACGGGDGGSGGGDSDSGDFSAVADTETCVHGAHAVTSTPDSYPATFPFPEGTVVFHVEDRGEDGVIATGVTDIPFEDVLKAMNAAQKSGFTVTSGETEEDDAEASWTGNGFTGRWAIEKSATCTGETVIQLLSKQS